MRGSEAPAETDGPPTIEGVAEHWDTINDETGYVVPTDLPDWSTSFLAHLPPES